MSRLLIQATCPYKYFKIGLPVQEDMAFQYSSILKTSSLNNFSEGSSRLLSYKFCLKSVKPFRSRSHFCGFYIKFSWPSCSAERNGFRYLVEGHSRSIPVKLLPNSVPQFLKRYCLKETFRPNGRTTDICRPQYLTLSPLKILRKETCIHHRTLLSEH